MANKNIQVVRADVMSTVKVDWTKRSGFKVSAIKSVDQFPKELGINVEKNSALVGVKVSGKGVVTVVGLDNVIRRPGSVAKEGRCSI